MRIYEVVDEQLLTVTKRASGFVQRWTGLTNFDMSRILICIPIFFWGIGLENVISIAVVWIFSFRIEKTIHPKFGNTLRIDPAALSLRTSLVLGTPIFISLAFMQEYFGPAEEKGFAMRCGPMLLMVIAILYLISIEPDPPSDSKIRKGLRSLRRMFQQNPLPVPS
jgi:hypothetical protein